MNIEKRISLIKITVGLTLLVFGILLPIDINWPIKKIFIFSISSFFFGILLTHAMSNNSLCNHLIITKPTWSDNPLDPKKILPAIQFIAFLLISYGVGGLTGGFLTHRVNSISVVIITGGIGILIGMYFTLLGSKKEK